MNSSDLRTYREKYRRELFENCIPFWLEHGLDRVNGGIYTCLTRTGNVYCADKSVWFQGRSAWTFSRLCALYGERAQWRSAAKSCIDFLEEHCIDPFDRRMYFSTTAEGLPLRKRRYFYSEAFYTIANAEYGAAFHDPEALRRARESFDFILGIHLNPDADPYKITPKVFSQTRSTRAFAPSIILLNAADVLRRCNKDRADEYTSIAAETTEEILKYHYKEDLRAILETTGANGEFLYDAYGGRTMNPGHALEGAWFLLNEAITSGDQALLPKVEAIFDWSMDIGWDKEYGGIFSFVDVLGYPPEQLEHDMKIWWTGCEAAIAAILLYEQTEKPRYWDWFTRIDHYLFGAFGDPEYGEWYGYLHRDGTPTQPVCKGSMFKGPFHLPRMLMTVEQSLARLEKKRIDQEVDQNS